jgi:hypothetical protein
MRPVFFFFADPTAASRNHRHGMNAGDGTRAGRLGKFRRQQKISESDQSHLPRPGIFGSAISLHCAARQEVACGLAPKMPFLDWLN